MAQEKFKRASWDFPSGPVVKIRLATEDMGSIPGWKTKIPHAVEQLNPRAHKLECPHVSCSN